MSEAVWRTLAEKAIGGRSLDTLATATADGSRIDPLYQRISAERPQVFRQGQGPWRIAQRIDHPAEDEANRLAILDLEGGANALTLVLDSANARGYGLRLSESALATALAGVELDLISVRLDAGSRTLDAIALLADLTTARRLTSASLDVDLGLDPIGTLAQTGLPSPMLATAALIELIDTTRAAGLAGRLCLADGRPYHEAGAGEAQELAAVLATGLSYLRHLERAGQTLENASAAIAFLLVADADTYLSIAKFRALRRLWAHVERSCGITPSPIRLHAETSWRMMTRRDPWVNVMRSTAAVFAAGVGGADAVTVLPFTLPLGLPDDAARRLARNTQLVLLDEAHLGRVADPAAGSGGLEALTDQLCERAWALFQDLERDGGIEASLQAGLLQARIAETQARRAAAIATLHQPITGTTAFPTLHIPHPNVLPIARHQLATAGGLALPSLRDSAPFETLRDRADAMSDGVVTGDAGSDDAASDDVVTMAGRDPTVFLATLGTPAAYGARATEAANFFAAAGIATHRGAADGDLTRYAPATMPVVCLCGTDRAYDAQLGEAVARLRAAGAQRVLVVGRATGADGKPQRPRCDGFIDASCDALQMLTETLALLETALAPRR